MKREYGVCRTMLLSLGTASWLTDRICISVSDVFLEETFHNRMCDTKAARWSPLQLGTAELCSQALCKQPLSWQDFHSELKQILCAWPLSQLAEANQSQMKKANLGV